MEYWNSISMAYYSLSSSIGIAEECIGWGVLHHPISLIYHGSIVILHILQTGFESLLLGVEYYNSIYMACYPLSELQKRVLDWGFAPSTFFDTMDIIWIETIQLWFYILCKQILKVCRLIWNAMIPFTCFFNLYRNCRRGYWMRSFASSTFFDIMDIVLSWYAYEGHYFGWPLVYAWIQFD